MIAAAFEGVGQSFVDGLAVVMDQAGLAVHGQARPVHYAPEDVADALVAQAHTQQGHPASEMAHHVVGDTSLERRARPWRDDDVAGRQRLYFLQADAVVAIDRWLPAQLTQVLSQVIDEGVVVVDDQYHFASTGCGDRLSACTSAWALSSVSWYSASGSES